MVSSLETGFRLSDRTFTDKRGTFRWGRREGQNGYRLPDGKVVTNEDCEFNKYGHACMPGELGNFVSVKNNKGLNYLLLDLLGVAESVFGAGKFDAQQTWDHNWTLIESGSVERKSQRRLSDGEPGY